MSKYKNLKKYVNNSDFKKIQEYHKQSAIDLNHYYPLEFNSVKNKNDKIFGLYYHITNNMLNYLNKIQNINTMFINDYNIYDNMGYIAYQSFEKIMESKAINQEIIYSNKIENYNVLNKKKLLDLNIVFKKITNMEILKKQIKIVQNLNNVNFDMLFRKNSISIFQLGNQNPHYTAINHNLIEKELCDLIKNMFDKDNIIDCLLIHIIFELIHPLEDGNGRFGRYLVLNLLINHNLIHPLLVFDFSKYINEDKSRYYKNFQKLEDKYVNGDCTNQIEYLLEKIYLSVEFQYKQITKNMNKIKEIYLKIKTFDEKNKSKLLNTNNKKKMLSYIIFMSVFKYEVENITRLNIQKYINSNKENTIRLLNKLEEQNIIVECKDLNTNIIYYKLKKIY